MTEERTPARIADLFIAWLEQEERGCVDFRCESKDDAAGLLAVLVERGWRAKIDRALTFSGEGNEMMLVYLVTVNGRYP